MGGKQVFLSVSRRHKIFKSLTAEETSGPLHEIGNILCSRNPAYTPSMWGAYFEEWVNSRRKPKGYIPRGGRLNPPLSANLEENILATAEEDIEYCFYTDDVAEYLRGKYGLFPYMIWVHIVYCRRVMRSLLGGSHPQIRPSQMRLYDGQNNGQTCSGLAGGSGHSRPEHTSGKAWSRYWPATDGHEVSVYSQAVEGSGGLFERPETALICP